MNETADPAAVFACALSLRETCLSREEVDPSVKLRDAYNGFDEFLRQVMRVADLFERWAGEQVAFEETEEPWPYWMERCFGEACLKVVEPWALAEFHRRHCWDVAVKLGLPMRLSDERILPTDVRAPTHLAAPAFAELRIQAVAEDLETGEMAVLTLEGELGNDEEHSLFFGLYGVNDRGQSEHIADRTTYRDCRELARRLVPGIVLPEVPIWRKSVEMFG